MALEESPRYKAALQLLVEIASSAPTSSPVEAPLADEPQAVPSLSFPPKESKP